MTTINKNLENELLILTRQFLNEMEAERAKLAVTLDASLEYDLGLGSLEKAELFSRIEKTFTVRLPDGAVGQVKNLRELIPLIEAAGPPITLQKNIIHEELAAIQLDPSKANTLVEVLELYAKQTPSRAHIYFQEETGQEKIITYGELYQQAIKVAAGLQSRGLQSGETVAIMLPTVPEFFYGFFGILLAGCVPVPIYPPFRPDQIEEYIKREVHILHNAEVRILITFQQAEQLSRILRTFIPSLLDITTVELLQKKSAHYTPLILDADQPALIQYTSGSTGNPKGVLLTHQNLLSNIRGYGAAIAAKPQDKCVSWLPLYHDMGLIGTWLGSLYYGVPDIVMSPLTFLARPERWLWTIHNHRATISGGPNFAYELCVRKIDESLLEGLDLSCWRLAFNGAEAIYPKTLQRFAEKFSRYGFKLNNMFSVYGLAESTVGLCFPPLGREPKIDKIAREAFEIDRVAVPSSADSDQVLEFVCCGRAMAGHEIRIADEKDNVLPERKIGALQFRGPSTMQGYYRNEEATEAVFHDGWCDSGDLAYIADEEVYIVGRKKDVIIKAGRNLYPAEIEEITEQVQGIRRGCVAAFGVKDPDRGTEKFVIVAETLVTDSEQKQHITATIIERVNAKIGLPPDQVILAPARTIPKTSSGKLRRSSTLDLYRKGKLHGGAEPAWRQFFRVWVSSQKQKVNRWSQELLRMLYTGYVGLIGALIIIPFLVSVLFTSKKFAGKAMKFWLRLLLKMSGCNLHVSGRENLHPNAPMIYVSNHTSYIDVVALLATLPPKTLFVAKEELMENLIFQKIIEKLGHLTVNRLDFSQSLADTTKIQTALQQGQSIFIFPEGTFTYATGLRSFKLGAFKLAVETGIAICPIALQGTRQILRSGSHWLRPHEIHVTILPLLQPQNQEWSEVIRLRNESRAAIAEYCGEPTLDILRAGYLGE